MSIENHPNFHAVKFVTGVMTAYYESLRGKASEEHHPDIRDLVIEFSTRIEEKTDKFCKDQDIRETMKQEIREKTSTTENPTGGHRRHGRRMPGSYTKPKR